MHYILVVLSLFLRNRGLWRPASVFSMWCDVMSPLVHVHDGRLYCFRVKKGSFPVHVSERWARSWSRCTDSQSSRKCDFKPFFSLSLLTPRLPVCFRYFWDFIFEFLVITFSVALLYSVVNWADYSQLLSALKIFHYRIVSCRIVSTRQWPP